MGTYFGLKFGLEATDSFLEPQRRRRRELRICDVLFLTFIFCSPYQDDFIVLHVANDYDSVLESLFKTEFLHVLSKKFEARTKRKLDINFSERSVELGNLDFAFLAVLNSYNSSRKS